jgi:hypothetical protein
MPDHRRDAGVAFLPLARRGTVDRIVTDWRRLGIWHARHLLGYEVAVLDVDDPDVTKVAPLVVPQEGEVASVAGPGESGGRGADQAG